jgi:hypothetical protein
MRGAGLFEWERLAKTGDFLTTDFTDFTDYGTWVSVLGRVARFVSGPPISG